MFFGVFFQYDVGQGNIYAQCFDYFFSCINKDFIEVSWDAHMDFLSKRCMRFYGLWEVQLSTQLC